MGWVFFLLFFWKVVEMKVVILLDKLCGVFDFLKRFILCSVVLKFFICKVNFGKV